MAGKFIKRYWFLLITVTALAIGLALPAWPFIANAALLIGAAVGLALAMTWTIAMIRNREFGSDSLAVIAIVASVAIGEFLAAAIVSLMLATGRALEEWAKGKSQRELKALLDRAPTVAHLVQSNETTRDLALAEVQIGARIRVLSGEVVPIDGMLISDAEFDESALTGEPMPVRRFAGDLVSSGVVNSSSTIEIEVSCSAQDSTYANLVRLVEQANSTSARSVRLANRWALWFVPLTLAIAAITLLFSRDVHSAVAVLIAATPCPLILAIPVALISGMSKSAARGALIKGGQSLELLAKAKTVMLDKTGTLTQGGPSVTAMAFAAGESPDLILQLAASLELHSPHVVARAIVAKAEQQKLELLKASDVVETHGQKISGHVSGKLVTVGQPDYPLPSWAELDSELHVAISINGNLVAVLGLDDPVREETIETIANLRKLGIERIVLVSGDKPKNVHQVATLIAADEVFAECSPTDKLNLVAKEMKTSVVVLVGDGINDAPALAAASVGVAMGARGATAASEAADVVIIEDSISHLANSIDVSQGAFRKATQAGSVGMALALISMMAAALGALNPTQSAVVQEVIDATAILWALTPLRSRLKKKLAQTEARANSF